MMPILDLQRRLREIGRIRMGEQRVAASGKKYPAKLATFRLTSQDETVIAAAAQLFGGTHRRWDGAPAGEQWEVTTTSSRLDVIVPPGGMAFSQFYEQWSGGGCQKRCDGRTELISDRPCSCDPDPALRECKPHTRLSVILRDLPGLGVWRLDTSGYYAAVELAGVVEVCERASAAGQMLPARLMIQEREVKRIGKDGKPETRKFGVPTLDVDLNLGQLMSGAHHQALDMTTGEIGSAHQPAFQPVGQLPPGPQPSVAEQVAASAEPKARPARKNAQTPIPATSVRPRTAAQAAKPSGDTPDRFHKVGAAKGLDEEQRRAIIGSVSDGRTTSAGELTAEELAAAFTALEGGDATFDLAEQVAAIGVRCKKLPPESLAEYTAFKKSDLNNLSSASVDGWTPELVRLAAGMLDEIEASIKAAS